MLESCPACLGTCRHRCMMPVVQYICTSLQTLQTRPGVYQPGRAGADHTTLSETIDRAACCPAWKTRAYTCLGGDRRDFVTGGCWGSAGVGYRRPAVGADPTAQPPSPVADSSKTA